MSKQHVVIYVPGLGDYNFALKVRKTVLSWWHFKNVSIVACVMNWTVDEPWQKKFDRLLALIDEHYSAGKIVSLIGESAGATAVMLALNQREDKLNLVIFLCGKSQFPERVAAERYRDNPAFKEALNRSHQIVALLSEGQKAKLLNLHPLFDETVPVSETKIPDVKDVYMPILGHAISILFATTFWSWRIVHFIRKLK